MFCEKCGKEIPEGATACPDCEKKSVAGADKPVSEEVLTQSELGVVRRTVFSSQMAFVGLILLSVGLVLMPFALFPAALVFAAPGAVSAVGMWLIHLSAKDKAKELNLKGLKLIDAASWVQIAATVIVAIALYTRVSSDGGEMANVVIAIVIGGFLWYCRLAYRSVAKWALTGGETHETVYNPNTAANTVLLGAKGFMMSKAGANRTPVDTVIVLSFIFGGFAGLIGIIVAISGLINNGSNFFFGLDVVLVSAANIVYGLIVAKYRSEVKEAKRQKSENNNQVV